MFKTEPNLRTSVYLFEAKPRINIHTEIRKFVSELKDAQIYVSQLGLL